METADMVLTARRDMGTLPFLPSSARQAMDIEDARGASDDSRVDVAI
jgi:hypothetical protein